MLPRELYARARKVTGCPQAIYLHWRQYSRLQLRWFRPKPGARRLLRFARAASRESRPISRSSSQDWFQPLQAFVNRNFAAGSRIRNLLHQTLSLLTDKDRRTDCWIRRKQTWFGTIPTRASFEPSALCTVHQAFNSKSTRSVEEGQLASARAGVRFIVKCIYEPKEVVLLLSFICYFIRDGPTDLVWSSYRVPYERETSTLKRRRATKRTDRDTRHCRCFADVFR